MATFLVRVELHSTFPPGVYDRLHAALSAKGLENVVMADDGGIYRLPSATYRYAGEFTAIAVRDWVQMIVDPIHPNNWVLVADYSMLAWKLAKAV